MSEQRGTVLIRVYAESRDALREQSKIARVINLWGRLRTPSLADALEQLLKERAGRETAAAPRPAASRRRRGGRSGR